MKRIRIIKHTGLFVGNSFKNYATMPEQIFIDKFMPPDCSYCIVGENDEADICCYGVGLNDDTILRDNELNVFVGVENLAHWGDRKNNDIGWCNQNYFFYQKYKHFGSKKTNIYIHNDKYKSVNTPLYKCIPTIYCRISYFERMKEYYKKIIPKVPFKKKKFILFISTNGLNKNKRNLMSHLTKHRLQVHHISMYNSFLKNTSCYHSKELLTVFSQYKFIAAFENSHTLGYTTEKIFNVFFARSIPIYDGAPNIGEFINSKSFLSLDSNILKKLTLLGSNKQIYERILSQKKIQDKYKNLDINFNS